MPVIRVFDCHVVRIIDNEYRVLMLLRSTGKIYAGTWRMVGGKIAPPECAWQAALREVGEETGLIVKRLLTVPYVNRFYEWRHDRINDIPVFVALVGDGELRLDDEHSDFEWVSPSEALNRLPWPGQREGLKAALALLESDSALEQFLEIDIGAP